MARFGYNCNSITFEGHLVPSVNQYTLCCLELGLGYILLPEVSSQYEYTLTIPFVSSTYTQGTLLAAPGIRDTSTTLYVACRLGSANSSNITYQWVSNYYTGFYSGEKTLSSSTTGTFTFTLNSSSESVKAVQLTILNRANTYSREAPEVVSFSKSSSTVTVSYKIPSSCATSSYYLNWFAVTGY